MGIKMWWRKLFKVIVLMDPDSKFGMKKKKQSQLERERRRVQKLKQLTVSLDGATIKMAMNLGNGNLSLGIRRAVALSAMHSLQKVL